MDACGRFCLLVIFRLMILLKSIRVQCGFPLIETPNRAFLLYKPIFLHTVGNKNIDTVREAKICTHDLMVETVSARVHIFDSSTAKTSLSLTVLFTVFFSF